MAILQNVHGGLNQQIYGAVGPNGEKMSGEGFRSAKLSQGAYEIYFDQPFRGTPTAVCTIVGEPWYTCDKSVAVIKVDEWTLVCFTSSPNEVVDCAFTFIVMGNLQ